MKLLVTGGAGFIGSNYVRMILEGTLRDIEHVTVLDKLTYAGNMENLPFLSNSKFTFIKGDICNTQVLNEVMGKTDAIINFAAESHVDRSILNASEFVQTNVVGTQCLLDAALKFKVGTYLQVSTDEVYGSISEGSWDEHASINPNSPYSASKASADLIALSYFRTFGLDVRITRCSNNYGNNQFPEKIVPLFITNLLQNRQIPIYGTGENVRDWIHVEDHCLALHEVLLRGSPGNVYNIGANSERTNLELTYEILALLGKQNDCIIHVQNRQGHDFRYSVDSSKISRELGFRPKISIGDGLQRTISWYKENESWWRPLIKT